MWNAGPAVKGRQLKIPTCPPTTEDRLAELAAARDRWAAAGINDYRLDLYWSPTQPGPTMFRITVIDGRRRQSSRSTSSTSPARRSPTQRSSRP